MREEIFVPNIASIENYLKFGVYNNKFIAQKLLDAFESLNDKNFAQRQQRKIYFIRMIFEAIQLTEIVDMILNAVKLKDRNFTLNMAEFFLAKELLRLRLKR